MAGGQPMIEILLFVIAIICFAVVWLHRGQTEINRIQHMRINAHDRDLNNIEERMARIEKFLDAQHDAT